MKTTDLHVHSIYSDGTLTPTELVRLANEKNLSSFALTDHDTTAGIQEAIDAARVYNIEVVPGIEISSYYGHKEIHIVGLYIDYKSPQLLSSLNTIVEERVERNKKMCAKFIKYGINISYEDMMDKYANCVITRAHFADYLLDKGYVKSRNEAFDRYIGDHGPCYVERMKLSTKDAIKMILDANGIPVLAHPVLYHLGKEQMNSMLEDLTAAGLKGIETMYSTYTRGDELLMRSLAKKYGLFESGGSDFHGKNKPDIDLAIGRGHLCIPNEFLEKMKEYVLNK